MESPGEKYFLKKKRINQKKKEEELSLSPNPFSYRCPKSHPPIPCTRRSPSTSIPIQQSTSNANEATEMSSIAVYRLAKASDSPPKFLLALRSQDSGLPIVECPNCEG
jgi:hypothetical protein